jgi:hypothetical protein
MEDYAPRPDVTGDSSLFEDCLPALKTHWSLCSPYDQLLAKALPKQFGDGNAEFSLRGDRISTRARLSSRHHPGFQS